MTDRYLLKLFRDAVLAVYGNQCVICGYRHGPLEVHHIVHKRNRVLRYDPNNGVPVCSPLSTRPCHSRADTHVGRGFVHSAIGPETLEYIQSMECVVLKDRLRELGMSKAEYYTAMANLCKETIKCRILKKS